MTDLELEGLMALVDMKIALALAVREFDSPKDRALVRKIEASIARVAEKVRAEFPTTRA